MKFFTKRDLLTLTLGFIIIQVLAAALINKCMFHPVKGGYFKTIPGYVNIGTNENDVAVLLSGNSNADKVIMYCHGNAEDITCGAYRFGETVNSQYLVASIEYPGYGLASGKPTEAGCYENAHKLYDWLRDVKRFKAENIIVAGYSLGTGVALELASTKPVGGLLLEAPFLSAPRAVTRLRLLVIDPFPNVERMQSVNCPVLIIHGRDDRIVPFAQGEKLFKRANFPKRFIGVDNAGHNDIIDVIGEDQYSRTISDFVATCGVYSVSQNLMQERWRTKTATYGDL